MGVLHKLENAGRRVFAGSPAVKRLAKGVYQRAAYLFSPKIKCDGSPLTRVSPRDGASWFFGYYDKCPWNADDSKMLCLRAPRVDAPAPDCPAEIMLLDAAGQAAPVKLAETRAWNLQQGAMAQWLGPDFNRYVLYNDFRAGRYCAVIFDVEQMREVRTLDMPVYTVDRAGRLALTADFSRLHRLRPGYGYANLPDATRDEACPDAPCVWRVDLTSGRAEAILKYTDLKAFEPRPEMEGAQHKVNHLMLNPSGTRVMLLHRWLVGQKKYTRLITMDTDGKNLCNLSDENFVSHCNWKNDTEILGYMRRNGRDGYYLLTDGQAGEVHMWLQMDTDGHMSYAPDAQCVVSDTYPNQRRLSTVYCLDDHGAHEVARVFSPFRYDGDLRCDLHPRFNRAGDRVCIDSTHEGLRGLYTLKI